MARTGLYKSEVKKARDALIAQDKHPSVDSVRIELGNTGSKTTIHKYLRELEEEDGGVDGRKASISEALQDLVARLAAQIQHEANVRIDEMRVQSAERDRQQAEMHSALRREIEVLSTQLQHTETAAHQELAAHGQTRTTLQQETIARHTAEQQATGLKERLAENEAHRASLEEKHQHAREALEHYRQSVKEQRDQDARRHEQQVQQLQAEMRLLQQSLVVKQDDLTRLNQEAARLVADLSHAQKALFDQQSHNRHLGQKLEALQAVEQRAKAFEAKLTEREAYTEELKRQAGEASRQSSQLSKQMHGLELELAGTRAKLEAQHTMAAELRAYMERKETQQNESSQS